jgi:hypothetical protein
MSFSPKEKWRMLWAFEWGELNTRSQPVASFNDAACPKIGTFLPIQQIRGHFQFKRFLFYFFFHKLTSVWAHVLSPRNVNLLQRRAISVFSFGNMQVITGESVGALTMHWVFRYGFTLPCK